MAAASVLICEDSGIYAAALRRTLEYDGDINVISVCGSAEEALAAIRRLRPDLITMDIELPGMDGLTAVEIIMGTRPMPIFWVSIIFIAVFSVRLGLVPSGHMRTPGTEPGGVIATFLSLDFLRHLALPMLMMTAYYGCYPLLVMRASMLEGAALAGP